jgi:hypothetical protein
MNYINSNTDKQPIDSNGYPVDTTNQLNLIPYDEALKNRILKGFEVSRVLTNSDVWCLDIDNCIDGGLMNELAQDLLKLSISSEVYIETSLSGKGLHVWGKYSGEFPPHNCKNTKLNIELYTDKRVIILGDKIEVSPLPTIQSIDIATPSNSIFDTLVNSYFGESLKTLVNPNNWQTDAELDGITMLSEIRKRPPSKVSNPFNSGMSLNELLEMKKEEWEKSDKSSLDMSLLNNLAFHCKKHHEQIELVYRASNIGKYRMNEKVNKLDRSAGGGMSYLVRSILQAVGDCSNVFISNIERVRDKIENHTEGLPDSPAGYYLKDFYLIYDGEGCKFHHQPSKREMSKTCFKDAFRIGPYDFEIAAVDRILGGKTYYPGEGLILKDKSIKMINLWMAPPEPEELSASDKDLIDDYFKAMCPLDIEREHLKKWCSHLIQHPQDKILHAILLYGFDTGTGKSTLGEILQKTLGEDNTARINNKTINDQFNGWLTRNTFGWCDEINTSVMTKYKKNMVNETIKEWITNRSLPIREMQTCTVNAKNWINGILFTSNNDDALLVDDEDRRLFIVKVVNNMLINRIINSGGFTRLNHEITGGEYVSYFNQINIDDFNPSLKAPVTSAKREMIENTKDPIEEIIKDEIESGGRLATNDYVFLGKLAEREGITGRSIAKQLRKMGYVKHNTGGARYWYKHNTQLSHSEIKGLMKLC